MANFNNNYSINIKNMSNILFRTDSSSTIGTGHIMRDLVLAQKYAKKGHNIIFATQNLDNNINEKIVDAGYTLKLLKSNSKKELVKLIKNSKIDLLVIDHYKIDYKKELYIKEKTDVKILSFDDTYEKHNCDILLNHNISADKKRYKGLVPKGCKLKCGSKYTLLREEFYKEKDKNYKKDPNIKTVFIAMGGADTAELNVKILKVLSKFKNIKVNLVTTTANKNLKKLQTYTHGKEWIDLHINSNKIAKLMKKSDLAIVTPSVTVNEVYFMELPLIAIKTANNQDDIYNYLEKNNFSVLQKFNKKELEQKLQWMIEFLDVELINFINLSLDEKKMVLKWRNTPAIKKWMFNQNKIDLNNHLHYIESLKQKKDRLYFLLKSENQAIGVIDFTNIDTKNNKAEFGIYANPNLRGKGNLLMSILIQYAFKNLNIKTLKAEVFAENLPAIKLYIRYNFKEKKRYVLNNKQIIQMELKNENR